MNTVHNIFITVIIPTYNLGELLEECVISLTTQSLPNNLFEIIIIDDCSMDKTKEIALSCKKYARNIIIKKTTTNLGPGAARNIGINFAKGDYILFLDGDDILPNYALSTLYKEITTNSFDAYGYNWAWLVMKDNETSNRCNSYIPMRRDLDILEKPKDSLMRKFIGMGMDGSVIYTLVKRSLIIDNNIVFQGGLHEDIFFIFQVYYFSKTIKSIDNVLYLKRKREGSIVNSISKKHIEGYLLAWNQIYKCILDKNNEIYEKYKNNFHSGIFGVFAVLIGAIYNSTSQKKDRIELLIHLEKCRNYFFNTYFEKRSIQSTTRYDKITLLFLNSFQQNSSKKKAAEDLNSKYLDKFFIDG